MTEKRGVLHDTKKEIGLLVGLLVLTGVILVIAVFRAPHAILTEPEETTLYAVHLQNFSGDGTSSTWTPSNPAQQQTAQEIVQFLASQQETYTTRGGLPTGYPADWACITLMLNLPDGSVRSVILGPPDQTAEGINCSYDASGKKMLLGGFQGNLSDPMEIRAFVLDALGQTEAA